MFLVANTSNLFFIIYQVLAHVMASGGRPACVLESSDVLVELEAPPFIAVLVAPDAMVLSIRGNGVDSRFFRCGSTKSTLVPDGFSASSLSWVMEFLKSTSNLDCMAPELSACSLLILSILVSRFHNLSLTVSYLFFNSSISILICFSPCLSIYLLCPPSAAVSLLSPLQDIVVV